MYDLKQCPLCNEEYLEDTTLIEYSENGKYYYDMQNGHWCLPEDMQGRILKKIDQILVDSMTLRELCMKLMEIFDLTMKTACNYTRWLINTLLICLIGNISV